MLHRVAGMDNFQTRYAHLLQPIKDLTKNWDVDVAAELEDYLALVSTEAGVCRKKTHHRSNVGSRAKIVMVLDQKST